MLRSFPTIPISKRPGHHLALTVIPFPPRKVETTVSPEQTAIFGTAVRQGCLLRRQGCFPHPGPPAGASEARKRRTSAS